MANFQTNITESNDDFKAKINASNQRIVEGEQMVAEIASTISSSVQNVASLQTETQSAREIEALFRRLTNVFLLEEERRIQAIRNRYQAERDEAQRLFDSGKIDQTKFIALNAAAVAAEEREMFRLLLAQVESYGQKRLDTETRYNALINEAKRLGNEQLTAQLEASRDRALSQIDARIKQEIESWSDLFENLDNLTARQINRLVATIEEGLDNLKLRPEQLRAITDELERAKEAARELSLFSSLWRGMIGGLQTATSIAEREVKRFTEIVNPLGELTARILAVRGDSETAQLFRHLQGIATGAAEATAGMARLVSGDIVGGIRGLATGIGNVVTNLAGMRDARHQREIERLQRSVNNLRDAYTQLGREIENAFSTSRANLLEQKNENLRQQNAEIQRQIQAERNKKNSDAEAIRRFEAQIEANNRAIDENRRRATEAIIGTEIRTAISDFANAYANAWAQGINAAESAANVVQRILRNAFLVGLKDGIEDYVEDLTKLIGRGVSDNNLDTIQGDIDILLDKIGEIAANWEKRMRPHLDQLTETQQGVTGELQKAMTEGTASQLVGLWNMTAMDIRDIRNHVINSDYLSNETLSPSEIYNMTQYVREISFNTYNTAHNTERIGEIADGVNAIRTEMAKKGTVAQSVYQTRG